MTDDDPREQTDGQKEDRTEGLKGFRKFDEEPEKHTSWYIEIPIIIVIAPLISVGVQSFIDRAYVIPSKSMQPTLSGRVGCIGDRIWVDKVSYQFSDPKPGDATVFNGPEFWNSNYVSQRSTDPVANSLQTVGSWIGLVAPDGNALVKHVIATGGQTVQCRPGSSGIMVDGKMTEQNFAKTPVDKPVVDNLGSEQCGDPYFRPVIVPEGHLWVVGDNRANSAGSRYHMGDEPQGIVPLDSVAGKV